MSFFLLQTIHKCFIMWPYQDKKLRDRKNEYWKDLPGYLGEYEISSLGRVKSLSRWRQTGNNSGYYTKEIIRKQHVRVKENYFKKDFTYTVCISLKSKGVSSSFSTARLVYKAFVEDFDISNKDILVSYKDSNGKNISFDNLELSNRSGITKKSFKSNRKHSSWADNKIQVDQYDLKGKLLNQFSSISEASKQTGFTVSSISACANGKIYQHKKFHWKISGAEEIVLPKPVPKESIVNYYLWEKIGQPKFAKKNPLPVINLADIDLDGEEWREIQGAKGYYISNLGRAKSIGRLKSNYNVWQKGVIKRLIPDGKEQKGISTSCLLVQVSIKGKKKYLSVARLVYQAFVAKIKTKQKSQKIKFRNGCYYDLRPENLVFSEP